MTGSGSWAAKSLPRCAGKLGHKSAQTSTKRSNGGQTKVRDWPERFWRKVDRTSSGCWLWTGALTHDGYGRVKLDGRVRLTHRVSWQLTYGVVPVENVLHTCDTPRCVNPEHLFLGGQSANMCDASRKGRIPYQKLSDAAICAIKTRYAGGGISMEALGHEHGVSASTIHRTVHETTERSRNLA